MKHLKAFLTSSLFDFILVLVLSAALSFAVLSGFDAGLSFRYRLGIETAVIAGFLLVLYAGAWSRPARAVSTIVAVVYFAAALAIAFVLTPAETEQFSGIAVNDAEGNYAICIMTLLVVALLAYLLSRSRVGVLALVLVSVFGCCVVQYLFRDWMALEGGGICFIVVLVSSVTLLIYRRYSIGVTKTDRRASLAFGAIALFGLIIAALSAAIASLLFFAVIQPLNLDTPVLKPFEYRIAPPIVDYTGAYDEFQVEDPEKFTSLLNEREDETQQNAKGGEVPDDEQVQVPTNPLIQFLQSITIFNEDDWSEDFDPHTIERMQFGFIIAIILILLAIVAAIALRIRWRVIRLNRFRDKPYSDQVIFIYDFLLSRFAYLGLGKPEASTPLEYAYDSRRNLVPFTRGTGGIDFVRVTLIYQRAAYGEAEISQKEYTVMRRYYRAFFLNAHRYVGTPKWLWKFWRV